MDGPSPRLRLRVSPAARTSGVVGRLGEAWKIRVAAPPEDGKANDAVLELLTQALGVPRRCLELVSGRVSRDKVVVVQGLTRAEAERRLAAATSSGTGGARLDPREDGRARGGASGRRV